MRLVALAAALLCLPRADEALFLESFDD